MNNKEKNMNKYKLSGKNINDNRDENCDNTKLYESKELSILKL